jgi:iron(III) transport system ATP-binding protein
MSSVRVQGLTKRYGTVAAAYEVSFDVASAGTLALLGPRGCGKTTILLCLAGLETPDWGTIEIDGAPVFDRSAGIDVPPEGRGMGIVLRSYAIWPHMRVLDNVAFPLKVRGVPPRERNDRAGRMLDMLGLRGLEEMSAAILSAEQRQRIALARALVHEPKLVLFDEAMSNLDPRLRQQRRGELRSLQERLGFTAIHVTNDPAEAFGLADEIILMNQGAIETSGPAKQLFSRPPSTFAARFLGMNLVEGRLLGVAADNRYLEVALSERLVVRGQPAPGAEFAEGGRVLACIHKAAVRVSRPRAGEDAPAVIIAAAWLGADEEYLVDIDGVRLEANGPAVGLVKGDKVRVAMTPDDWVFVR